MALLISFNQANALVGDTYSGYEIKALIDAPNGKYVWQPISVQPPILIAPLEPYVQVGVSKTLQVLNVGGIATGWAATGLPPGVTIDSATGVISATATTVGTSSITVSATNAGGSTSISFNLVASPVILRTCVMGAAWTQEFIGEADPSGRAVAVGNLSVPWTGVDRFIVDFDGDASSLALSDFSVEAVRGFKTTGLASTVVSASSVTWDSVSRSMTISLSGTIADAATYRLRVPKCSYARDVVIVPGDVDGDGLVSFSDVTTISLNNFTQANLASTPAYNPRCDINANGVVLTNDTTLARVRQGTGVVRVSAPIAVAPTVSPSYPTGVAMSLSFYNQGGEAVSSATGACPGLSFNASANQLSGTPTTPGTYPFTVTFNNYAGSSTTGSFNIVIP